MAEQALIPHNAFAVMPPKALGNFRDGISATVRRHVVAEIHKDLAGLAPRDIERHLQG